MVNQIDKNNMFDFVFYQIDSVSVNQTKLAANRIGRLGLYLFLVAMAFLSYGSSLVIY